MVDCNQLQDNLAQVKVRISRAASSVDRDVEEIKLIAVSKGQTREKILFFKKQGIKIFGENRVQELLEKEEHNDGLSWHFIGHLQRNKVKYLVRMNNCKLIHSLDSYRLAKEIHKRAGKEKRVMPVLIQVNTANDDNKFGLSSRELPDLLEKIHNFKYLDIRGLMTIAPYSSDPEEVRPFFRDLRLLKEKINQQGFDVKELSMGMSNDFEVAIEEGATIIRIGSALFGERGGI